MSYVSNRCKAQCCGTYIGKAVTPKKAGVRLTGMVETKRFSNSSNSTMGLPAWITGFAPD